MKKIKNIKKKKYNICKFKNYKYKKKNTNL